MKRWDVCSPRQGRDRTFWHRVGSAFEGQKGINIVFDSLPLPDSDGRVSVSLFEPRQNDGQKQPQRQQANTRGGTGGAWDDDLNDSTPF